MKYKKRYENIVINEYVIMPNHIHIILILNQKNNITISTIIGQYKGIVTKELKYSI